MTKQLILASTAILAAAICHGEAQRTTRSYENKFPELGQLELGLSYRNYQVDDDGDSTLNTFGPFARYGLLPNLSVYAEVPVAVSKTDIGSDGEGLGDIRFGLQLLAYEDVFEYPWVIPHIDGTIATGDEGKGLGTGEGSYGFGLSIGSRMYDKYSFVVDGTYFVNGGLQTGNFATDDAMVLSFSFVADISEKLAFVAEASIALINDDNEDSNGESSDDPAFIGGGMIYRCTERCTVGVNGGSWSGADLDTELNIRASYEF